MIGRMFTHWQFTPLFAAQLSSFLQPITIFTLIIAAFASLSFGGKLSLMLESKGGIYEACTYIVAFIGFILCALCLSTSAYNPFIYFRF